MPTPDRNAGGSPDDWGRSKSSSGPGLCLIMLLTFAAAAAALILGVLNG